MKTAMSPTALGRRVIPGTVLALAAATMSLGLAGPANAANTIEIQGVVTGTGGAPLSGANVYVVDSTDETTTLDSTTTAADGSYSFDALSAGPVKVLFSMPDPTLTLTSTLPYQDRWSGGSRYFQGASITDVTVDPATPATVSVTLPQYAAINGNLLVGDGHVPTSSYGWNVYDADSNNSWDNSSLTDPWYDTYWDNATGNYRLVVDPGAIRVSAYASDNAVSGPDISYLNLFWKDGDNLYGATPLTLAAGQTVTGVNFRLTNALTARQAPQVLGVPAIGRPLTGTSGTWSRTAGTEYSYSWQRGAVVVGTGATYTPSAADFGQRLSLTVTALNGAHAGQAATTTSDVVRWASDTKGKAKALGAHQARFTVKIVSAKQSPVRGKVVVLRGTKVVHKAVKLVKGKAVIVVKHQPRGKHVYTVLYKGNSLLAKAMKDFTVRIR